MTVSMTPNGYADAPVGDKFVLPHEELMKMKDFLSVLNDHSSKDVVYIQKQNSSFTDEFKELIPDAGLFSNFLQMAHFIQVNCIQIYVLLGPLI